MLTLNNLLDSVLNFSAFFTFYFHDPLRQVARAIEYVLFLCACIFSTRGCVTD